MIPRLSSKPRFQSLLRLALGFVVPLAAGCTQRALTPVAGAPVVIIAVDTLRADHLPAYGYRLVATPTLDALAGDAAVFERCLSHCPQTLPSHATIFTGLLPPGTGVHDNLGFKLDPAKPTLAAALKLRGYRTAGFVSAYVLRHETGIASGFDTWDDEVVRPGPRSGVGAVQRAGSETVARAVAWLSQRTAGESYLLFVHLYEPHTPYTPPSPWKETYAASAYDGEIATADAALKPLIDALRARGDYARAVIVFLSDHGEGLSDHGEREHGLFLYEEVTRVPLFVKPPGAVLGGRRIAGVAALSDVLPTVLALVGAPPLAGVAGLSLDSAMTAGRVPPRAIYAEALYGRYHFGWAELRSLSDERYRFIRAPRPELFDLRSDPGEKSNVVSTLGSERSRLEAGIDRVLAAGDTTSEPGAVSSEEQEKLAALGYLGGGVVAGASAGDRPDPKDRVQIIERYRDALALRAEGNLAGSVRLLEDILAREPGMADAWESLARAELDRQQPERAVAAADHLVGLLPGRAEAQFLRARALIKAGRLDEAALAAEAGRDGDPAHAEELLCRIRLEQGRLDEALAHADRALSADPRLALPHYARGVAAAAASRLDEALGEFRRAEELLDPEQHVDLRTLHVRAGDVLARLGRPDEAEKEFLAELALDSASLEARLKLAALYQAMGHDAEAVRVLREYPAVVVEAQAYVAAARALARLGHVAEARALLAAGRERFPGDAVWRTLAAAADPR